MIKLDHVSKSYGNDVIALDDVSVDIGKGEFVFVVGQSGSGIGPGGTRSSGPSPRS